ncbi:MAG: hypothetical protein V7631_4299 [Massilia sp.]
MKTTFRTLATALATALAASAGLTSAHAGVLTWQDVVFTASWTDKVVTLEIDAARAGGDWTGATRLGALSIKEIGRFDSVAVSAAPKGVESWTLNARELNAHGCSGGNGNKAGNRELCLSGTPSLLGDDMVFTFTFTGKPDLSEPHLKVNFLNNSSNRKIGDLLSQDILASTVVVPGPVTPPAVTNPPPVVIPPPEGEPLPPVTDPLKEPTPVILPDSNEVPEPGTIALTLAGPGLLGVALRKRR